jgi:hypothetical protein
VQLSGDLQLQQRGVDEIARGGPKSFLQVSPPDLTLAIGWINPGATCVDPLQLHTNWRTARLGTHLQRVVGLLCHWGLVHTPALVGCFPGVHNCWRKFYRTQRHDAPRNQTHRKDILIFHNPRPPTKSDWAEGAWHPRGPERACGRATRARSGKLRRGDLYGQIVGYADVRA